MDNKYTVKVGAELKDEKVLPQFSLKDKIDSNSDFEIRMSKDKIYAEYELRF